MRKFSVVVPVHNVLPYLRAALDSLRAQTVRDWEAVCVDDGSTDGSGELLDEMAALDPRIVAVHQRNRGVSAARNAALERVSGEIIAFLDPDDSVEPDWLARLEAGVEGVDLAWGGMMLARNGGFAPALPPDAGSVYAGPQALRRIWRAVFGYRLGDLPKALLPGGMWRRCGRELGSAACRAVRRETLGDLRFDERLRYGEDAMFLSALALRVGTMRVVGDTGYRYSPRPDGAMATEQRERMAEYKFAVRDVRQELDPLMRYWLGSYLLSAASVLRSAGPAQCLRYLFFRPFAGAVRRDSV